MAGPGGHPTHRQSAGAKRRHAAGHTSKPRPPSTNYCVRVSLKRPPRSGSGTPREKPGRALHRNARRVAASTPGRGLPGQRFTNSRIQSVGGPAKGSHGGKFPGHCWGAPQKTEESHANGKLSQVATGLQLANGSHPEPAHSGNLLQDALGLSIAPQTDPAGGRKRTVSVPEATRRARHSEWYGVIS